MNTACELMLLFKSSTGKSLRRTIFCMISELLLKHGEERMSLTDLVEQVTPFCQDGVSLVQVLQISHTFCGKRTPPHQLGQTRYIYYSHSDETKIAFRASSSGLET